MKKKSYLKQILCLLLAFPLVFSMAACPAPAPSGGTTGSSGSTGGGGEGNKPQNPTDTNYTDGAPVEGAGASLAEDAFAMNEHKPDEENAIETATLNGIYRKGEPEEKATYRLTGEQSVLSSSRIYNGNGAVIIAPNGVLLDGIYEVTLQNITIIGDVEIKGCSSVLLSEVEILSPTGTALQIDADSNNILLKNCRLTGKRAFENAGEGLTLLDSVLAGEEVGLADTSKENLTVMNCFFSGAGTALSFVSSHAQIRQNTLTLAREAVGISLGGNSKNTLIALNSITGARISLALRGSFNTAVILNQGISAVAEDNTSLYICDNSLGGRLETARNNYFLANNNNFPNDGRSHESLQEGNTNVNGDCLTDVTVRPEVGVNESLLPHTNKELFVGMERLDTVKVGAEDTGKGVVDYILETAASSPYVILAPGVYTTDKEARIGSAHSGTTLYAYGAQIERRKDAPYNLCNLMSFNGVNKFAVKGLTLGFERQSCGQVYVLDKMGGGLLLVVTGAGMDNEFGNTNPQYYSITGMGAQRAGDFYPYCDTVFERIDKRTDGLMEMRVSASVYEMIEKGDVLTCRSGNADTTVYIRYSTDISFEDVTLYGNSGGFAFWEEKNRTATTYHRLHNTTKNGALIDEATYNRYLALEQTYGVDLEIYPDGEGRYRGSLPHIGSIDATHTSDCLQGSVVVSCIFENMCDDATNQNHHHARVDELIDNGDGTATIVYKGNYSEYSHVVGTSGKGGYCSDFVVGDRVYVYTASGQLVCDTPALSVTAEYKEDGTTQKRVLLEQRMQRYKEVYGKADPANFYTYFYFVTVKAADVNFAAVEGLDMTLNTYQSENKVLIDNMSMASNGFRFDNVLAQNIRSRGLLIKASEGSIKNCSFRHIGMACAAILYEIYWGESGVSENLDISRNEMDHTGFFAKYTPQNEILYSPICIEGLGSRVEEDYLLYKNIKIEGNVLRNRTTSYAVYINSARDITVKNNDFGEYIEGDTPERFARAVRIMGAMNIEIAGNTYSPIDPAIIELITAEKNKNVFGADVEWEGEKVIPDSE